MSEPIHPRDIPIFILAGGLGTRFREQTHSVPKPMIGVAGKPILWHIMTKYAQHGFRDFVICAGYKAEVIKDYFLNYQAINSDFTVDMSSGIVSFHSKHHEGWSITVADTGADSMTGFRIFDATRRFLGDRQTFGVTYGDGLTDANLEEELEFHRQSGRIGTVLGIHPPARFGEIIVEDDAVTTFAEKRPLSGWISGGYFFFERGFCNYLGDDTGLVLEEQPLRGLVDDRQLSLYQHEGFWACMDTQRDHDLIETMALSGSAPWLDKTETTK